MTWWRWPATLLVDTPHGPVATLDGEVRAVLIDPGTEARSGGVRGALQLHRKPCDFCHAADFLRDSLSAELIFCSLS
jgi:hypothetical protein